MGVASEFGEQEAGVASGSGWNLWVWLVGVVVRRYIYILKCFSFLFQYLFVIKFYVFKFFFTQYKHIRPTTCIPRQPYEGCT